MTIKFTTTRYGKVAQVAGKEVQVRTHAAGRGRTEYGVFVGGTYVKTCKTMYEVTKAIEAVTA